MSANRRIPPQYQWVLQQLHNVGYKSATIAGGAIRDAYFGRTPKDVDIFLHHPNHSPEDVGEYRLQQKISEMLGCTSLVPVSATPAAPSDPLCKGSLMQSAGDLIHQASVAGRSSKHIHSVATAERNGIRYEFIFLKCTPLTYIQTFFDLGICKCWYDGSQVHYSHDFMFDVNNQTISIVGSMDQNELYSVLSNHVPRMQAKFPGYDIRIDPKRVTATGV